MKSFQLGDIGQSEAVQTPLLVSDGLVSYWSYNDANSITVSSGSSIEAYSNPSNINSAGIQSSGGPYLLGNVFYVNNPGGIRITEIGSFNYLLNGFLGPEVPTAIYQLSASTWTQVPGTFYNFIGSYSNYTGSNAFITMSLPIILGPATYSIISANYGIAQNPDWNSNISSAPPSTSFQTTTDAIVHSENFGFYVINTSTLNTLYTNATFNFGPWIFGAGTFKFTNYSAEIRDFIGNNNGILVNNPTLNSGVIGNALNFNGTAQPNSQYINCKSGSIINPPSMSICAWINGTAFTNAYNTIYCRTNSTTTYYTTIFVKSTGKIAMFLTNANGDSINYDGTGVTTLSTNTWYHVALTYDSVSGLNGYVNGVLDGSVPASGSIASITANSLIGDQTTFPPRQWNGKINNVRIYNRSLTANEVLLLYNSKS